MRASAQSLPQEASFRLLETLRFDPREGYFLLEAHLMRLASSSRHLGFDCPIDAIRAALNRVNTESLVRLLLESTGAFSIETRPLPALTPRPFVVLSESRVDSDDVFLRHKTTRRAHYDGEYTRASQDGAFEVLFRNERDELTEGSRTNLFVESDGVLLTPPLSCGLLPGTFRAHILSSSERRACEATLHLQDLRQADRIFVGNSVRGLVEVNFHENTSHR